MVSQTSVDTEELIESMGRFRRWVLPAGLMRELLSRGEEIAPELHRHLTNAMSPSDGGLERKAPEAFFCFYLLGGSQLPCHGIIEQLLRSDAKPRGFRHREFEYAFPNEWHHSRQFSKGRPKFSLHMWKRKEVQKMLRHEIGDWFISPASLFGIHRTS